MSMKFKLMISFYTAQNPHCRFSRDNATETDGRGAQQMGSWNE